MGCLTHSEIQGPAPLAHVPSCRDVDDVAGGFKPPIAPRLRYGEVLDGRFLVYEAVGQSNMATVHRAEDLLNGRREVAIKVLLASVESDAAKYRSFLNEEKIGLGFSHRCLLRFYSVTGVKRIPYIATEFLRGRTLNYIRNEKRPLEEGDAMAIAALVCEGLEHMHGQGIVHRDLKPDNIVICCDQTLRIIDFGLSSVPIRKRNLFAGLTAPFGTPEYMAPEQVENKVIDERTDIYALGAVLYELLTGVVPFHNADAWQSAFQRTTGDPIAPRVLNPSLSIQCEEIVLRAMRLRPEDRYQEIRSLRTDLLAPDEVSVTGICTRLRPPRWKLGIHSTPILSGIIIGFGALALFCVMFLVLKGHAGPK
jgi:serine/threonine protein kinase